MKSSPSRGGFRWGWCQVPSAKCQVPSAKCNPSPPRPSP
ncbi:MAG: hypothetical protein OJF55_002516 [Rhodanobacteraceae bacterium]|nr:MAG: hypothetical protein OJF55_002516 [Rhodanobacteraceae bacterium]